MAKVLLGNSNVNKEKSINDIIEKKIKPVTSKVKVKKQSELSKLGKQFIAEDANSVKGHILSDVVVPGIQRLLSDMVKSGIDWLLYGHKNIGNHRSGVRNISYSSYYDRTRLGSSLKTNSSRPGAYTVNDVVFIDRGEAEEVLMRLKEEIDRYGMVSVADFYDTIAQKHSYTDNKYGWKDLRSADIVRTRDGYSIKFPKIIPIE